MPKSSGSKIIIEGITNEGKIFRPSDWAERVCGNLSTFKNHRIHYSPLLKPFHKEGHRCVILSLELKKINPELYQHILDFATVNNLKISSEDEK